MSEKHFGHYPITEIQTFGRELVLWVKAPAIRAAAQPGQFVMVGLGRPRSNFLKRAISIHAVRGDEIALAILQVGDVSRALASLALGDEVELIGPLGQGFDLAVEGVPVAMVAGGIGHAPFRFLAENLKDKTEDLTLYVGGRDKAALAGLDWAKKAGLKVLVATEDGSAGVAGFVTALLQDLSADTRLYACGPLPMLAAVQDLALTKGHPCQLSLEGKMACGVGVCLGCTCARPDPTETYAKVCTDGPVFWAEEVDLHG